MKIVSRTVSVFKRKVTVYKSCCRDKDVSILISPDEWTVKSMKNCILSMPFSSCLEEPGAMFPAFSRAAERMQPRLLRGLR